jgi:hypothetical protein
MKGAPVVAPKPVLTPHGYFRRWIEGSDFSLEANTPAVPGDDLFYVLVAGEVRLSTNSFAAASIEYEDLCLRYWEERLNHADLPTRLLAARGLFRRNHEHPRAGELLASHGDAQDRTTVAKARHRASFLRRRGQ